MKCDFCGTELKDDDSFCSSCGSVRLSYKVLNRRAEKFSLGLEIIGIALIVFGIIVFFYFMDFYSDKYIEILNGINSQSSYPKEKAWVVIFSITYPSVITVCSSWVELIYYGRCSCFYIFQKTFIN